MELPPRSNPPDPGTGSARGPRRGARLRALVVGVAIGALAGLAPLVSASGPVRATLRAQVAGALASRFPGATLTGDVRLDGLLRVVAGPIDMPSTAGTRTLVHIERMMVRPRFPALLAGRLEIASVAFDGVQVDAGVKGEALADLARALASRRGRAPAGAVSAAPAVSFTRAFVRFGSSDGDAPAVVLGPLVGNAKYGRDGAGSFAEVSLQLPGAAGESVFRVRWSGGQAALEAKLRAITPAALPEPWRARLPVEIGSGSLDLEIDAPRLVAADAGEAQVRAVIRDLELRTDRLSPEPVGPLALRLTGVARWDVRAGSAALDAARLELDESGRAAVSLRLAYASRPEPRVDVEVTATSLDWEAMAAALPTALSPPPETPAVRGALAAHLLASGPLRRPEAWRITGEVDPRALEPGTAQAARVDLARPFAWDGPLPDGTTRKVVVGPQNPAFVPIGALPAHVVRAVLTSEDAGFYGHHGFDLAEIQDALAHSGEKRLRGASTITQQIAKNLFLSTERTYARKIREALTTVALEATVGKRRLLEIYLNMAEWGPGVFGIGEAARHWFGKDARDLSPKEAAFLATVIPNPIRYEMYRRRGALTETWEGRVRGLLMKLRAADVIDDQQFLDAWEAPLMFARGA